MNRSIALAALLITTLLFTTSCNDQNILGCLKGEGASVSEHRTTSDFSKVMLDLSGDVYITKDSVISLKITAQENIIDEISTEVVGETLRIDNERCLSEYKTIRIDISMPDVSALEVRGSGDIYGLDRFAADQLSLYIQGSGGIEWAVDANRIDVDIKGSGDLALDAEADEIETDLNGSGDLLITGLANIHRMDLDGSGEVKGFGLDTKETFIDIAGSGDCEVSATDLLDVTIKGSGDVYYKGNPAVNVDIDGSGDVIKAN